MFVTLPKGIKTRVTKFPFKQNYTNLGLYFFLTFICVNCLIIINIFEINKSINNK
jgi:hypothetical protein